MKSLRPRILLVTRAFVENKDGKILLIKRSKDDSYEPEKWEIPGGKLDDGQDIANALEREVLEETGLFVIPTSRTAYIESMIITNNKKYNGMPYVLIVGLCKVIGGTLKLSEEHDDAVWVTAEEAHTYDLRDEVKKALASLY